MNKKGVPQLVGIMIGFLVIITAIAISPAMKEQVSDARTNLDCTNTSLSPAETGTCILVDWLFFGFIGMMLLVGIGYIVIKRLVIGNSGTGGL